jgi:arsenate reductase-like glutaredoxin family protein
LINKEREVINMDQLTQMELLQIHELLGCEELIVKKCQGYQELVANDELQPFIQESITLHQQHLTTLVNLVRKHNGKGEVTQ